ncbi:MAG TPA: DUF1553 domain-containing protein, partial [Gemmataceae bacterium]|nr:DUF1553 domain-containing protein [Gemmataceae bacterium]
SNFGLRGDEPTHPELLDRLAVRFVESGWSIKAMHRLILLSKTYQLSSANNEEDIAIDPGNRWYWRYDRRRLDAEAIRDTMLALGGTLELARPGPHPFPGIDKWHWTQHNAFKEIYPSKHRSVYLMTQRLQRHPYLGLFDGPDTNTSTEQRTSSTVPQQALFLMNNPFVGEQAQGFARWLAACSTDPRERVRRAYELAYSRPATPIEVERGIWYLDEYRRRFAPGSAAEAKLEQEALTSFARVMLCANELIFLD